MIRRALLVVAFLLLTPVAASADVVMMDSGAADAGPASTSDDGDCAVSPGGATPLAMLGLLAAGALLAWRRRDP